MTRCAIYIRKSREEKDKPSHRLTVQRQHLPAYAATQGWQVTLYDDGHASAARGKAINLPERARLEADIRSGKIDIILVIELSRLSRDDTLQDYLQWLTLCADYRVKLATLSRTLDPSQHSDWMLLLMEGGFSTVEMKIMQDRMREGRQEAFRAGKYLGGPCPPPYYYDKAQGKPAVDQVALARCKRLWQLAETNGCSSIARELNMPLIAVRRALQEERLLFYQAIRPDPDTGELIPCDWPAVMTAEQAQLIRQRREDRKRGYSRSRYGGLLSNLQAILVCGYCGRTARSWKNQRKYKNGGSPAWYGCKALEDSSICTNARMIPQEDLDATVVTNLINTIADPESLHKIWQTTHYADNTADQLDGINQQIQDLQTKKQRLITAITEGVIDFADAKKTRVGIEIALQSAQTKRSNLLAAIPVELDWNAIAITRAEFENLGPDDQREIILTCIQEIKLYHSYAIITYRFPRDITGSTIARIHLPPPKPTRPKK
ncbi:recombinase family protein [Trichlorobacter lovleyi]|uniref:recombinase family protein n=1 Tax=Trichlorobacter lovleyi TaxID=313985 RepID=UPI003D0F7F93